ncbi:hypothetical protein BUE93_11585 [Chromobacterium amazonense]|uniref:Uncharacterized protein n=1 Tax=Chromobacterium amazonense TaxID=1382803 RepID=A0A2S9X3P1_9NEIS|nr:hypothetical protein BUE93_11585 [Chromobacterium amazonense]
MRKFMGQYSYSALIGIQRVFTGSRISRSGRKKVKLHKYRMRTVALCCIAVTPIINIDISSSALFKRHCDDMDIAVSAWQKFSCCI